MDPELEAQRRIGTTLRNKWTLERLLGQGGMAAVYVGVHKIGRREAIKILNSDVAREPEMRARFEQEANAVNRFTHPGAVEIRDIDVADDGAPFLVMELLEGDPLSNLARRPGGVPVDDLLRIVDELLDVLVAAHAQAIIHRDIKPDNLFVQRDGRLKVLDFGIARVRAGAARMHTRAGATLGTAPYMPPEQIKGMEIDARADLFAVGATMFRILARRRVHEAGSETELMVKMATEQAPSLASVAPDVPRHVCLVVDRALMFEREQRYPDAATMQADIRAVRAGLPPPYANAPITETDPTPRAAAPAGATLGADAPTRVTRADAAPVPSYDGAASGPKPRAPAEPSAATPPIGSDEEAPLTGTEQTALAMAGAVAGLLVAPIAGAPSSIRAQTVLAMGGAAPGPYYSGPANGLKPEQTLAATPNGFAPPNGEAAIAAAPLSASQVPTQDPLTRPVLPELLPAPGDPGLTPTPLSPQAAPPPPAASMSPTLKSAQVPDLVAGMPVKPHGYAAPVAVVSGPHSGVGPRTQAAGMVPLGPGESIPVVKPSRYRTIPGTEISIVPLILVGALFASIGVALTLWFMLRTSPAEPGGTALDPGDTPSEPAPGPLRPPGPARHPTPHNTQPPRPSGLQQPGGQPQGPPPQQPPMPMGPPGGQPPDPPGKGHGKGHGR
jgi:serine/threonine-protein kinase